MHKLLGWEGVGLPNRERVGEIFRRRERDDTMAEAPSWILGVERSVLFALRPAFDLVEMEMFREEASSEPVGDVYLSLLAHTLIWRESRTPPFGHGACVESRFVLLDVFSFKQVE